MRLSGNGGRAAAHSLRAKIAKGALLGLAALAVIAVAAIRTVPELVLYGERLRVNILAGAGKLDLDPIELRTADGLALRSWYAAPAEGRPLIVYFPDRLGDIVHKSAHLSALADEGYGLLLAGYRGYGGNPGRPSEGYLYRDAAALLAKIERERLAPGGVVVYGYSMGTGIASYAATIFDPLALVLESPFTTFADAVRQQAHQVPAWLVRTKFDTSSRIAGVDAPILLLSGGRDTVTPPVFAETLAGLTAGRALLHVFPQANHVNVIRHGGGVALRSFLAGIGKAQPLPAPQHGDEIAGLVSDVAGSAKNVVTATY